MTLVGNIELPREELDAIAWKFFGSEFAGQEYIAWGLDQRVYAYLRHHGLGELANDGSIYEDLLDRVMAGIGRARRTGLLAALQ